MTDGKKIAGQKKKKETRFYVPPNILRQKVGVGGIDPLRLEEAEEYIDNNRIDFAPYAIEIMNKLNKMIKTAKKEKKAGKENIDAIARPIMELKANGGMFGYILVSEIAGVILNFLENVEELNDDGFDIIDVHQSTLETIVTNRLTGDGGREGRALAKELYEACQRYKKKYRLLVDL